jgi:predicted HTH transcriptional regulator
MNEHNSGKEYQTYASILIDVEKQVGQSSPSERCLMAIKAQDGSFTAKDIHEMTGIDLPTCYDSIKVAMILDMIQEVGQNEDTKGRNSTLYKVSE